MHSPAQSSIRVSSFKLPLQILNAQLPSRSGKSSPRSPKAYHRPGLILLDSDCSIGSQDVCAGMGHSLVTRGSAVVVVSLACCVSPAFSGSCGPCRTAAARQGGSLRLNSRDRPPPLVDAKVLIGILWLDQGLNSKQCSSPPKELADPVACVPIYQGLELKLLQAIPAWDLSYRNWRRENLAITVASFHD